MNGLPAQCGHVLFARKKVNCYCAVKLGDNCGTSAPRASLPQGNVYSGDEDFFEGSEFSQTESDRHAPGPSESGWGTHSAPDERHPEEKQAKAIERKLSMRPLWAASALYADRATTLIKNLGFLSLAHSIFAFLCIAESITRLD